MSAWADRIVLKARTLLALGVANLRRVLVYRMGLKTGLHPVCRRRAVLPAGPFYLPLNFDPAATSPKGKQQEPALYFGWLRLPMSDRPPDWHLNPLSRKRVVNPERSWWKIPDFHPSLGDIKAIWEASRFDWVLADARLAAGGDGASLKRLNDWLADWCENNPAYLGPNWKCGQEASIRVMHLAMAAFLLHQQSAPAPALVELVQAHLGRIAPTIHYAVAQDNNHGTSEAAALFIGGTWLAKIHGGADAGRWAAMGRKWLENRVARLVMADGSFSQYSVNYHRLLLDTLCVVEIWRRSMNLTQFSQDFRNRCCAAVEWLGAMVDPDTGEAPNMGANDGAWLLPLPGVPYRDFRPSLRLAWALLNTSGPCVNDKAGLHAVINGFFDFPSYKKVQPSRLFPEGGYVTLRGRTSWAVIRFARFSFRPSHADCLHLDLWYQGQNMLRDGGSYSYHTDSKWIDYFSGTASHNTVQFDDRDQMPRLGRFLFGAWLQMDECTDCQQSADDIAWTGAYTDWRGSTHRRSVVVSGDVWRIKDEIAGFKEKAILRWRLKPADWGLAGNCCRSNLADITVRTGAPARRMELVIGWESLFYQQKTELPVFEIEVGPGRWIIETEIQLKA